MTPKDKAQELYNKYFLLQESATDENRVWIVSALNKGLAKKCALIAVDEILSIKPDNPFIVNGYYIAPIQYWREVKQEIEKL